jgi:hypothetical protein
MPNARVANAQARHVERADDHQPERRANSLRSAGKPVLLADLDSSR